MPVQVSDPNIVPRKSPLGLEYEPPLLRLLCRQKILDNTIVCTQIDLHTPSSVLAVVRSESISAGRGNEVRTIVRALPPAIKTRGTWKIIVRIYVRGLGNFFDLTLSGYISGYIVPT